MPVTPLQTRVTRFLDAHGVRYRILPHRKPVFTVADGARERGVREAEMIWFPLPNPPKRNRQGENAMTEPTTTYVWPGETHFGFGVVARTGREARKHGASHVFIVTDPGVVAAGLLEPVTHSLDEVGLPYTLFDGAVPNPDVATVDGAAAACRQSGADLIIGLGGGSALDTAKGVRLLVGGPPEASIAEYALILRSKRRPAPPLCDMPPMLAIPTTAGTASEVTPWAIVTRPEEHFKFGVGGAFLIPTAALVDPELTLSLPPHLTAATGIDALSHALEAYVSTNPAPAVDALLLDAIERVGRSLRVAVAQGSNRRARYEMALASYMAGVGFSTRWLGACHSLAHQLSGFANVHHGTAIALMLPAQMAYSLPGALERYARVAEALDPSDPPTGSLRRRAEAAVERVRQLIADVGLPARLRDVGVTEEMLPAMAKSAYRDLNWTTNPRHVDEAALEHIYRQAF
ncbi:MAG: iron-containing alcohol dehydrogenase [Caldilineae bacterium]|nr:MAG: iron-containing alcohol dehydrogenase [Caldilineae bacterium]